MTEDEGKKKKLKRAIQAGAVVYFLLKLLPKMPGILGLTPGTGRKPKEKDPKSEIEFKERRDLETLRDQQIVKDPKSSTGAKVIPGPLKPLMPDETVVLTFLVPAGDARKAYPGEKMTALERQFFAKSGATVMQIVVHRLNARLVSAPGGTWSWNLVTTDVVDLVGKAKTGNDIIQLHVRGAAGTDSEAFGRDVGAAFEALAGSHGITYTEPLHRGKYKRAARR